MASKLTPTQIALQRIMASKRGRTESEGSKELIRATEDTSSKRASLEPEGMSRNKFLEKAAESIYEVIEMNKGLPGSQPVERPRESEFFTDDVDWQGRSWLDQALSNRNSRGFQGSAFDIPSHMEGVVSPMDTSDLNPMKKVTATTHMAWLTNDLVFACGSSGAISLLSRTKTSTEAILRFHKAPVRQVAVSSDSRGLISASFDGNVGYWDIETGKVVRSYSLGLGSSVTAANIPYSVACIRHGEPEEDDDVSNSSSESSKTEFLAGFGNGEIRLFDARASEHVRVFKGHSSPVSSILQTSDRNFSSVSGDRRVLSHNLEYDGVAGTLTDVPPISHLAKSRSSKAGSMVVAQTLEKTILVLQQGGGGSHGLQGSQSGLRVTRRIHRHDTTGHAVNVAVSPFVRKGERSPVVACGTLDGKVAVYSTETGKCVGTLKLENWTPGTVAYNCEWNLNGSCLAVGLSNGAVEFWL